ncbi:MAG TPA: ABC transporter permease [Bryobacteraceae bacterium]|jgi:predicted permease|nr:ABC transporter permease [Bryobacteraceae bacterium]
MSDLLFRLRSLFFRRAAEAELDEELAFHLEHETGKLMRSGLSPEEARRRARMAMGGAAQIKEDVRDQWIWRWCRDLARDVRYAIRALRQSPTFTAVAVLSLALGIGANTAIFSILNAVIMKPLPVLEPDRLGHVFSGGDDSSSNAIWEQLRDHNDVFSSAFAYAHAEFDLAAGGEKRPIKGIYASGDYFRTLGVGAQVGRVLTVGDDRRGAAPIAVLSYGFWQRAYGGDPQVAGHTIRLSGHPFEIVGVTPRSFFGLDIGSTFDVIVPLTSEALIDAERPQLDGRSYWWLSIIGRLKPGVSFAQAADRLAVLSPAVYNASADEQMDRQERAEFGKGILHLKPAAGLSYLRDQYKRSLLVLMSIAGLVLLIACVNIANLLLARAGARGREIAIRQAVGAGRGRLIRQLLTESVVLSMAGAACGVVLARWFGPAVVAMISQRGESLWLDLAPDLRVLAFTSGTAILTGILFGLAPAVKATRTATAESLKQGGRSLSERLGGWRLGRVLVVLQVALSLLLVVGAGLFVGTLRNLARQSLGFRAEGVLLVSADLQQTHDSPERQADLAAELLTRVRAIPGVVAAARAAVTPLSGSSWGTMIRVDTGGVKRQLYGSMNLVSPGYFATMQTPLLRGRDFGPADTAESPHVAILNEQAAREFFPGADPVGKTYSALGFDRTETTVEIVGVAADAKYRTMRDPVPSTVYTPITQKPYPMPLTGTYEIRFAGSAAGVVGGVKEAARAVDPRISLEFRFLSAQVASAYLQERLVALLAAFFGLLALVLACAGLYGVVSYGGSRRRSEVAIRLALGSSRAGVLWLMLRDVAALVLTGVPLGLAGSWLCGRLVRSMLYGVTPSDPLTLAGASAVLLAAAFLAGFWPARRAARMDPVVALREE